MSFLNRRKSKVFIFLCSVMSSTKEFHQSLNTLSCLVIQCIGHRTTVELRNEGYVTGLVSSVDGFMNVTMKKVTFVDPLGNRKKFDEFFVQNRLIRIVQIPSVIDIKAAMTRVESKKKTTQQTPHISRARQKILKVREERRMVDSANAALIGK